MPAQAEKQAESPRPRTPRRIGGRVAGRRSFQIDSQLVKVTREPAGTDAVVVIDWCQCIFANIETFGVRNPGAMRVLHSAGGRRLALPGSAAMMEMTPAVAFLP